MTDPVALCDIRQVGDDSFVGQTDRFGMAGLFGGQLAALALAAGLAAAPPGWAPQSLHAYFLAPGREGLPVELGVTAPRDGSRSCHRRIDVTQDQTMIAEVTAVFAPEEAVDRAATPIDIGDPGESPAGTSIFHRRWNFGQLDIRPAGDPQGVGKYHPVWLRSVQQGVAALGEDWGLAAFASDLGLVLASMDAAERKTSRAVSTDHSVWFHRRPRLEDWHLLEVHRQSRIGQRAIVTASLTADDGALVASVAQGVTVLAPRSTPAGGTVPPTPPASQRSRR
jgi:acyl-CoA thioesterase II